MFTIVFIACLNQNVFAHGVSKFWPYLAMTLAPISAYCDWALISALVLKIAE